MKGNKAVDLQLQTEKHFHIQRACVCVCVAVGFPVVPVQGIPLIPAEGRASEGRATPRGERTRERRSESAGLRFIFTFHVFLFNKKEISFDEFRN